MCVQAFTARLCVCALPVGMTVMIRAFTVLRIDTEIYGAGRRLASKAGARAVAADEAERDGLGRTTGSNQLR